MEVSWPCSRLTRTLWSYSATKCCGLTPVQSLTLADSLTRCFSSSSWFSSSFCSRARPVPYHQPCVLSIEPTKNLCLLLEYALTQLSRPQALLSLAPVLAPFFHLSHPTRGSFPGPITKLPATSEVRKKALEVVWWMERVASEEDASEAAREGVVALRVAADRAAA